MHNNELDEIINTIAKGDTAFIEGFFKKPGGRKYLENITLILINSLPTEQAEKEELLFAFINVLNKMQRRIKRQEEGEEILTAIFSN
jgi:hypothetical protein